jgi:KTSC domain-containing protein
MRVATVDSTTLATVAYDEARELLQLEFCNGVVYLYFGVPEAVHEALLGAPSKGRYFNQTIRGRFPFRLIGELYADAPNAQGESGAADKR